MFDLGDIETGCTLATAALLLVSVTGIVEATGWLTVTVPCATPPTPIVDALSVMSDNTTAPGLPGALGELESPHPAASAAGHTIAMRSGNRLHSFIMRCC